MLERLTALKDLLDYWIWGFGPKVAGVEIPWLVLLLLGTGLFVTLRLAFVQVRLFRHGVRVTSGAFSRDSDGGDLSHFQALSTALSATVGIGNIAGVAAAIHFGGPGALFWMWVTAFFGMALKYTECTLAVKYRSLDETGAVSGGPMRYMEKGLGRRWLAMLFAAAVVLCSFGQGNAIQSFTVADSLRAGFGVPPALTGLVGMTLVGLVIVGGVRRIGAVAGVLAPFMALFYVGAALLLLALHLDRVPGAFAAIFRGAFSPADAAAGGILATMLWGVKRGLFSNESGQGSAPIAHAAAKTEEPVREGVVALLEPFIDTLVICSMTGLAILCTGAHETLVAGATLTGSPLTAHAFRVGLSPLGDFGHHVVTLTVMLFAVSTAISWSYYGDRCTHYLFGARAVPVYRVFYTLVYGLGSVLSMDLVWGLGDVAVGAMAVPNLIAILLLSGEVARMTRDYEKRQFADASPQPAPLPRPAEAEG